MKSDRLATQIADMIIADTAGEAICEEIRAAWSAKVEGNADTAPWPHAEVFARLYKRLDPWDKKFAAMLRAIWDKERKIILANLKKVKKWAHTDKLGLADIARILYASGAFKDILTDSTYDLFIQEMKEEGQNHLDDLDLHAAFDVDNPRIQKWLEEYCPKLSKNLEEVNIDDLKRVLREGIAEGEGIPDLAKRVNEIFESYDRYRAELIARSETIRGSMQSALEAYRQSGVVKEKIWMTAEDDRTCFLRGTKVLTIGGWVSIDQIKPGDRILNLSGTHQVLASHQKKTRNKIAWGLNATANHPFWTLNRGWVDAGELRETDRLCYFRGYQSGDVSSKVNFAFGNSNNLPSVPFEIPGFSFVSTLIPVPIDSIDFQCNAIFGQRKIDRISSNGVFLKKWKFKFLKSCGNLDFQRGGAVRPPITSKRTKPSLATRDNSELFPTCETNNNSRWSSTCFRAIKNIISFLRKYFSAPLTWNVLCASSTTFPGAYGKSVCDRGQGRKRFSANRADFNNPLNRFSSAIAGPGTIFMSSAGVLPEFLPALKATQPRASFGGGMIAFARAIFGVAPRLKGIFWDKLFATMCALKHPIYYIKNALGLSITVYNLTIEDDPTFFANGYLVHNCDWCMAMQGKVVGLEENYFDKGDEFSIGDSSMSLDYTDTEGPPLHPGCRCAIAAYFEET